MKDLLDVYLFKIYCKDVISKLCIFVFIFNYRNYMIVCDGKSVKKCIRDEYNVVFFLFYNIFMF